MVLCGDASGDVFIISQSLFSLVGRTLYQENTEFMSLERERN